MSPRQIRPSRYGAVALLVVACAWGSMGAHAQPTFAEVAPIFEARCTQCHGGDGAPLGLRLDGFEAVLEGSRNGPAVVPGDPDSSELVRRVRGTSEPRMPLTGPPFLSDAEIERVAAWVRAGARPAPDGQAPSAPDEAVDGAPAEAAATGKPVTFADVKPILLQRCATCHRQDGLLGPPPEGLRLDAYESVLAGSDRIVVVPGAPGASELMRRIEGRSRPRMPFDGPPYLDAEQEDLIRAWIEGGAPDAAGREAPLPVGEEVRLHGTLTDRWRLDGLPLQVAGDTRIEEEVMPGAYVEVRGVVRADGTVRAERIRTR